MADVRIAVYIRYRGGEENAGHDGHYS
jgi:hypothetical protein